MDTLLLALGQSLLDGLVNDFLVHRVFLRNGIGDEHAALELKAALGAEHLCQLLGAVNAVIDAEAALAGVERGQLAGAVANDGDALGLQILKRQAEVKDRLCARADDHNRGLSQLLKVGGNVHRGLGAAVYAADAAGGEDLDASHVGDYHGGGDGGSAVNSACDERGQVAAAGLGDIVSGLAEVLYFLIGESRFEAAADNGDGRGDCAVFTYGLFDEHSGLNILRVRHTVGNDGALQRDDGLAGIQRFLNLRCYVKILIKHFYTNTPLIFAVSILLLFTQKVKMAKYTAFPVLSFLRTFRPSRPCARRVFRGCGGSIYAAAAAAR